MNQPLIIAHRGASHDAPENTLAAFREAWLQGADGIEGDYCLTSDEQIVCIHDDDTLRTGGRQLVVAESRFEQLAQLEYGGWKDLRFHGEPLPRISDILVNVPVGKWCVIELKTGPQIVPLLQTQLAASGIDLDRVLVIAFDSQTIAESKRLLPQVKAHWLTDYRLDSSGNWSPSAAEVLKTIRQCGADGLGSENRPDVVTRQFLDQLRAGGIAEFHVWTVDNPSEARYFRDLGAWGLTTNRPAFLRGHLG
jgi:glycerophosphoryl diester phosphodiesterase